MSSPRLDLQTAMAAHLRLAGFAIAFSPIYWSYLTGFPKSANVSKLLDKRAGAKREVVGKGESGKNRNGLNAADYPDSFGGEYDITAPATEAAKEFDGAYCGAQLKPAVEVVLVVMKPLSEKTYVDQALANGKGITWLDRCKIPIKEGDDPKPFMYKRNPDIFKGYADRDGTQKQDPRGRFPANLLVSGDALGAVQTKVSSGGIPDPSKAKYRNEVVLDGFKENFSSSMGGFGDSGSYSRMFDLDAWFKVHCASKFPELDEAVADTFPFLIVPKPSKAEKDGVGHVSINPLTLMSYLITLGSREGDRVLDPYVGSGTTALAAARLNRHCRGIELRPERAEAAYKRLRKRTAILGKQKSPKKKKKATPKKRKRE